jgi:DNA primase catalytic core
MQWVNQFREVDRRKIVELAKKSLWSKEGKEVFSYLKNERGFSEAVIDEFDFGFCPSRINHQLRGRIITPIYDVHNTLIALSTRSFYKGRSFWHETFAKKMHFYGLNFAKNNILKFKKVIIVEGEFDVASLHTAGFKVSVGLCGSSFTLSHAVLLARYCSDVYFVFDGDKAGDNARKGAMEIYNKYNLEAHGIRYIPINLPDEIDPNDYIKDYGASELKKLLVVAKEEYDLVKN